MQNKIVFLIILLFSSISLLLSGQSRGLELRVNQLDPGSRVGKQRLVLIAVNRYREWPHLQYPTVDAKAIRDILTSRYYIDEVIELYDEEATKANILKLFANLQKEVKTDDSLLIYYAGHGHLDNMANIGFWILTDGGVDEYSQSNWLPNSQIRGLIRSLRTKHFLLISDSCFSGDLLDVTRAKPPSIDQSYFKKAYSRICRQVLTSGASEAVPDRSEFTFQLKLALENNHSTYLDPLMIYNQVRLGISKTIPLLGNLQDTGHQQGASFILFLKPEVQEKPRPGKVTAKPRVVMAKEYGSLRVETGQAGSFFVDGEFLMDVPAQSKVTIENLGVGERTIEIRYKDGTKELETLEIKKDETQLISFVKPEIKEKPTIVEVKPVIERELGNLVVTTAQAGSLFVDGGHLRDIPANGKFTVENLEGGEHKVEMRYAGNKTEVKSVQIAKDEVQEVSFIEVLIAEKDTRPARMQRHHFTAGVGAGLTVPVGDVGAIMMLAFYPTAFFNFNLSFFWGVIGFGILTGTNIQSTRTDVASQYDLLSIPIAVTVKYSTNFDFPLYGFVEVASGLAVNALMYKNANERTNNATTGTFFLAPAIGGGYYFIPELAVSVYSSVMMIFFGSSTYIGISPGLRVEFNI